MTTAQRPVFGAGLLILSMAFFALSDAMAKQIAGALSAFEIAWFRYLALLTTAVPVAWLQRTGIRSRRPGLQAVRAAALVGSAVLFLFGLKALPVAEATAMVFASPLFVTLLAALLLREVVPAPRWIPVLLGFAGVLIVVRPGGAGFGGAEVFPLLSSLAWALAVVCTRRLNAIDPLPVTMLHSALLGCIGLGLALPGVDVTAVARAAPRVALMAGCWCAAQWLVVLAYRFADPSRIAPFAYAQLIWAGLLGFALFGHVPDAVSLLGMGTILVSGALAAWQSRAALAPRVS